MYGDSTRLGDYIFAKRHRYVIFAVISAIAMFLLLLLINTQDPSVDLPMWYMASSSVIAGGSMPYAVRYLLRNRLAIKRKEQQIVEVQQEINEKDLSILELLERAIRLAITREEASMLRAEGRANVLFRIGLLFMIASVLAPLLSASLYWNLEPLSATTAENLKGLRAAIGSLPQGTAIPVQRDWRVLLGGISFGFLFLAAAAGLMKQQGRQTDIYFRTGERVKYFERLASVVNLQSAAARKRSDGFDRELLTLVTEKLMVTDASVGTENGAESSSEGSANVSPASEILRALNSIR